MISFIIIGKNVQYTIVKCIESILNSVKENKIDSYELLYIDSQSIDNTLKLVQDYNNVTTIILSGKPNAAVARNVGFKESKGSVLIFIDGDMELIGSFLPEILEEGCQLKYDFVSGDLINYFYDYKGNFLDRIEPYFGNKLLSDQYVSACGGIFAIKRHVWESVGGMKNYYRRSQDIDLALRLAKKGTLLLRKKELFVKHHTISYYHSLRFKRMIINGDYLYNGLIFREHFFNKFAVKRNLRNNSSAILLLLSIPILILFGLINLFFYFFVLVFRNIIKRDKNNLSFLRRVLMNLVIDIQFCIGFLLFYPKNTSQI